MMFSCTSPDKKTYVNFDEGGASISTLVTFACPCFLMRNERVEGSVGLQQLMMTIIRQMLVVMILDVRDGAEKRDDDCHDGSSIA